MADLDTRSKRASSVRLLRWAILALPLPDSTISQGDRQHIVADYSGILAGVPVTLTPAITRERILYVGPRQNLLIVPPRNNVLYVPKRPKLIHDF